MLEVIISLISGALGGNIAGAVLKNFSMGTALNAVVGIVGGGLGGQLLGLGTSPVMGAEGAGLDIGALISNVVGSGVGGSILMVVIGMVKNMLNKS
ncbi:MAG: hypothetical protein ACR2Q4_11945 [Geminicoccaceae bacterium]